MDLVDFLLNLPKALPTDDTESDTRAKIIDPVLSHLGWTANEIKREPYAGWSDSKGFIDYLLSVENRPMLVLEAKKTGCMFNIPQLRYYIVSWRHRNIRLLGTRCSKQISANPIENFLVATKSTREYTMHLTRKNRASYRVSKNAFKARLSSILKFKGRPACSPR